MARHVERLSALFVKALSSPGYFGDGNGLYLQVSKGGGKSWIFRFSRSGKRREMGLGALHTVSLAMARELALSCRRQIASGRDPIVERDSSRTVEALARARAKTFDQCAASYISAHRNTWKSAKHAAQWEATLATYASPVFGGLAVADVSTELVMDALRPIWNVKTETAVRLRGRIESVLDWATVSKFRQGDNPARWRGHLDNLLGNPAKIAPVKNHPALPWLELPAFMADLYGREGMGARALQFAIFTACRSGEVRGASWAEIDLRAKLWTIPSSRMKAGKEHRVPLSAPALRLLASLPREGDLIFHGAKLTGPLSDMSLTAVLRRLNRGDITVHGFRSTFRDWGSEAEGNAFSREVCEHALAHSLPDKVEAAYRRGDLLEKRISLMEQWGKYCVSNTRCA
jgi:integrase